MVAIEKGTFGSPFTKVANFTFAMNYYYVRNFTLAHVAIFSFYQAFLIIGSHIVFFSIFGQQNRFMKPNICTTSLRRLILQCSSLSIISTYGGARGVMVIVAGCGHGDPSSNPGLTEKLTLCHILPERRGWVNRIISTFSYKDIWFPFSFYRLSAILHFSISPRHKAFRYSSCLIFCGQHASPLYTAASDGVHVILGHVVIFVGLTRKRYFQRVVLLLNLVLISYGIHIF